MRECCFTTVVMAFQNQRPMEKYGFSTRFATFYFLSYLLVNNLSFEPLLLFSFFFCVFLNFKNYTQYIPLSIFMLQTWMGSPSIYVFDCSASGLIVSWFLQFAEQREKEYEVGKSQLTRLLMWPNLGYFVPSLRYS